MSNINTNIHRLAKESNVGIRFCLLTLFLCGMAYSYTITTLGGWLFPKQATGSLIVFNGCPLGSELVGQLFTSDHYFQGRPSAANYDPTATAGSNLAPDNPDLRLRVSKESLRLQQLEGTSPSSIPVDRLAASGSGLDPHISPQAALMQVPRIAKIRGMQTEEVEQLVRFQIEGPQLGLLGQPRINVLLLNMALDARNWPESALYSE